MSTSGWSLAEEAESAEHTAIKAAAVTAQRKKRIGSPHVGRDSLLTARPWPSQSSERGDAGAVLASANVLDAENSTAQVKISTADRCSATRCYDQCMGVPGGIPRFGDGDPPERSQARVPGRSAVATVPRIPRR